MSRTNPSDAGTDRQAPTDELTGRIEREAWRHALAHIRAIAADLEAGRVPVEPVTGLTARLRADLDRQSRAMRERYGEPGVDAFGRALEDILAVVPRPRGCEPT
jgi:hypothetical protein